MDSTSRSVRLRRVGNSLGVIIPRVQLDAWGLQEGDEFELTEQGLRVVEPQTAHAKLDAFKLRVAAAIVAEFPLERIRAKSIENLERWRAIGSWCSAYDEWLALMREAPDARLLAAMLGRDDDSNRLRQSPPFVGLLPDAAVQRLREDSGVSRRRPR